MQALFCGIIIFIKYRFLMSCNKCTNTRKSVIKSVKEAIKEPSKENVTRLVKKMAVGLRRIIRK
jgi:uncharacterized membrane protein (DUF106 family)